MTQPSEDRAAFEKWWNDGFAKSPAINSNDCEELRERCWLTWQAARTLPAAPADVESHLVAVIDARKIVDMIYAELIRDNAVLDDIIDYPAAKMAVLIAPALARPRPRHAPGLDAWQRAIEAAAKVCDGVAEVAGEEGAPVSSAIASELAALIRALASTPAQGEQK